MVLPTFKNRQNWVIAGLVAFFVLFAVWLRLLPMLSMGHTDILTMVGSDDPLYNLRQVEQLLANHLTYAWFEPMTLYPNGTHLFTGARCFPSIIIEICLHDHWRCHAPGDHRCGASCPAC